MLEFLTNKNQPKPNLHNSQKKSDKHVHPETLPEILPESPGLFGDSESSDSTSTLGEKLTEAHNRAADRAREARRRRPQQRQGSVRLSNTDSRQRAHQIRRRLNNKLSEITRNPDLERDARMALSRSVMNEISRVDRVIRQIRRREEAIQEEKLERNRAEREQRMEERLEEMVRSQERERDMRPRSTRIRRDFLYPAREGGLNPNDYAPDANKPPSTSTTINIPSASVSFDVGGVTGTVTDVAVTQSLVEVSL